MNSSAKYSIQSIRSVIRLPIFIVNGIFFIIVISISFHNSYNRRLKIALDLDLTIKSQESLFVNELFLKQQDALKMRLQRLQNQFEDKFPEEIFLFTLTKKSEDSTKKIFFNYDLTLAGDILSVLKVNVDAKNLLTSVFPMSAWIALFLSTIFALIIVQLLGHLVDLNLVSPLLADVKRNTRNSAIASTTQAFAHDVRKPFSMMLQLLDALNSDMDSDKKKKLLQIGSSEIKKSLKNLDILIQNIMKYNQNINLNLKTHDPTFLIVNSLSDLFAISDNRDIRFIYEFNHINLALADLIYINRAIVNIIANAYESMEKPGIISFSTQDFIVDGNNFIQISIHNSGSYIDESTINKIFELFYTKSKAKGTGIGLATTKKIIEDHGGEIICRSDKEAGTCFIFALRSTPHIDTSLYDGPLPATPEDCGPRVQEV